MGIYRKEGNFLIQISKKEAQILNKNYGVPFHENGISHTYSKHKHYYLCENKKNMNYLQKIRNKKLVRTVE